jgi:hypothetical protein
VDGKKSKTDHTQPAPLSPRPQTSTPSHSSPSQQRQEVNPVKLLNDQDYPVKDYFVASGQAEDRTFSCMFCDFTFPRQDRSNASIYRSMYKHMFLRHIPHIYRCPLCAYINHVE